VQFREGCRVTIQQMGGVAKKEIKKMIAEKIKIKPVLAITGDGKQYNFLDGEAKFEDEMFKDDTWVNYYREDDFCATAYYYLDRPE